MEALFRHHPAECFLLQTSSLVLYWVLQRSLPVASKTMFLLRILVIFLAKDQQTKRGMSVSLLLFPDLLWGLWIFQSSSSEDQQLMLSSSGFPLEAAGLLSLYAEAVSIIALSMAVPALLPDCKKREMIACVMGIAGALSASSPTLMVVLILGFQSLIKVFLEKFFAGSDQRLTRVKAGEIGILTQIASSGVCHIFFQILLALDSIKKGYTDWWISNLISPFNPAAKQPKLLLDTSKDGTCSLTGLTGIFLFGFFYTYFSEWWANKFSRTFQGGAEREHAVKAQNHHSPALEFMSFFIGFMACFVLPLVAFLIQANPILWLWNYIFSSPWHWRLLVYWTFLLALGIPLVHVLSPSMKQIIARKLFHVLACLLFFPASILVPRFLLLSYAVALSLLYMAEVIRFNDIQPLSTVIQKYYERYLDSRDLHPAAAAAAEGGAAAKGKGGGGGGGGGRAAAGPPRAAAATHLYLLLGCALPTAAARWMISHSCTPETPLVSNANNGGELPAPGTNCSGVVESSLLGHVFNTMVASSGVLVLGIGDAMAAVFGVAFGRKPWHSAFLPSGSGRRTLEGSLAMFISMALGLACIMAASVKLYDPSKTSITSAAALKEQDYGNEMPLPWQLARIYAFGVSGLLLVTLLEAWTTQIDNLILPLYSCNMLLLIYHLAFF